MITIEVDEGYAYDYLAILNVKRQPTTDYELGMMAQIGIDYHKSVVFSPEYLSLVEINIAIFEAVAKRENVIDLNEQRYKAKVALQKRFFPESKVTEVKI